MAVINESEIKKMKRGELNEYAATLGLNPDEFKKVDDLRSAVFSSLAENEKGKKSDAKDEEATTDSKSDKAKDSKKANKDKGDKKDKKPKVKPNPARPRHLRASKRYQDAYAQVEKGREYSLEEAVELAIKTSTVKFDGAIEAHINLGVDPKQSDQLVRGHVVLPHGSGKSQRVAAIVPEKDADKVKAAGADLVGHEDLLDKISKGKAEFDILVAHPDVMKDLSKQAKVLGPKGLMPSPKAGTVTADVAKTVKELKSGRIEYRVDRYGVIHQIVGRASYKPDQLQENLDTLIQAVKAARPNSIKSVYLQKIVITSSMGPGIKLDLSKL
ncbi:MAG: 50S ribosomal protein L1 [Candidatus Saccharimonadales bacterium]